MTAQLIVLGGLAGSGKSTLARHLALKLRAPVLRVETIEADLARITGDRAELAMTAYQIAASQAEQNLRLGLSVITVSVSPSEATRDIWRRAAARAEAQLWEIEILCSDPALRRARRDGRAPDLPGHMSGSDSLQGLRAWNDWPEAALRIDTAGCSPDAAVGEILGALTGT